MQHPLTNSQHRPKISANHYEMLGVKRNASADEIRAAYRRLASKHHPDRRGGDEQLFKAIQRAYDVLSDPVKRKFFDEHGSDRQGPTIREKAMQTLCQLFIGCVADVNNAVETQDVISFLSTKIREARAAIPKRRDEAQRTRRRLVDSRKRLRAKSGIVDILRNAIDVQIRGIDDGLRHLEDEIVVGDEMLRMLEGYTWSFDAPSRGAYTDPSTPFARGLAGLGGFPY